MRGHWTSNRIFLFWKYEATYDSSTTMETPVLSIATIYLLTNYLLLSPKQLLVLISHVQKENCTSKSIQGKSKCRVTVLGEVNFTEYVSLGFLYYLDVFQETFHPPAVFLSSIIRISFLIQNLLITPMWDEIAFFKKKKPSLRPFTVWG